MKAHWAALLLGVLLPLCAMSWWVLNRIEKLQRDEVADELETVLSTTKSGLLRWAQDVKTDTKVTANQELVRATTKAQLDAHKSGGPLNTPALQELRTLLEPLTVEHGRLSFAIIAPDGTQIATRHDALLGQREFIEQDPATVSAALAGQVVLGLPFRSVLGEEKHPSMLAAAPVHDSAGAVVAALVFRLDPARDFTAVVQLGRLGETGETYAFDRSGRLVTESRFDDQLRSIGLIRPDGIGLLNIEIRDPGVDLTKHAPPSADVPLPLTKMARSAITGNADIDMIGYRDYRGVPVVGAWSWSEELQLGITTEQDFAEAYAPIHAVRALALAMLGALFLGAILVNGLLYYRAHGLAIAVASEQAAVRMREEMIAAVSHDLRNPLNAIMLNASTIRKTAGTERDSSPQLAQSIENIGRRMARLIDDLLECAQLDAGKMKLVKSPQQPSVLIEKAMEILAPLASVKNIEIERRIGAPLPDIWVDADRLCEVFSNIGGNSIKHVPVGGKVTVGVELIDQELDFWVSDNGPGIRPEELPHIFDRFWRGKSYGGLGVGLGLYITKQIVESHGGRIWADNAPGQGAVFHFRISLVTQPEPPSSPPSEEKAQAES